MDTDEINVLSAMYAQQVYRLKIGAIKAVRAYGACLEANERPSLNTVERFYEVVRPLLADEYTTTLAHLSSYEQRYLEQQIARRVYRYIAEMAAGSASR
jgi:hypothetical protein